MKKRLNRCEFFRNPDAATNDEMAIVDGGIMQTSWTNRLLWLIYLSLLGVLLPHTAWAFGRFEPVGPWGVVTAWAAAFAFEAAIAALTHKLAQHIEHGPKRASAWRRFTYRYLNAYAAGLLVAVAVSTLANLAHSVEFGQVLAIFDRYSVPFGLYAIAFGAVLPATSLLFARVLAHVADAEAEADPELAKAKQAGTELRAELRETNRRLAEAEQRAGQAEQRFDAAGELFGRLFAEEKRQRILAAAERWPGLPAASIAIIAEASPSYVSETLKEAA
jgi:vacuolar-type H+-ATPase subunit H